MSEVNTVLPSMRVDGQVALVTGAGRGIGRGCALASISATTASTSEIRRL